ncbi:MAG: methyltransferase domain-containing protein [Thermoplasmata archaeon]|nr:methyltransferase domain-containing protein [Thermoplasmata archaeon]
MPRKILPKRRATVFGRDPEAYDRARLRYPPRVYEILTKRCGLGPGASVFEIGPGTGIATRELLAQGADPLTLIEPDRRLVRYLTRSLPPHKGTVEFSVAPFQRARLPAATFDLGVAASSFHWTSQGPALRKVARLLRPGGWWASWNNVHGDSYRPSPFDRALGSLYPQGQRRAGSPPISAATHRTEGLAALQSVDEFERISREDIRWNVVLTSRQVTALWGTFSDSAVLPAQKRRRFLRNLGRIVDDRFGGKVDLPIRTYIYTARRK